MSYIAQTRYYFIWVILKTEQIKSNKSRLIKYICYETVLNVGHKKCGKFVDCSTQTKLKKNINANVKKIYSAEVFESSKFYYLIFLIFYAIKVNFECVYTIIFY